MQVGSQLQTNLMSLSEAEASSEANTMTGAKVVLKRRQKYLYDYFFPKNMRDSIEERNMMKQSPAQGKNFLTQHKHMN